MRGKPESVLCRHVWEPRADSERIWKVCQLCGLEQHGCYHADQAASTIAYIFRDFDKEKNA